MNLSKGLKMHRIRVKALFDGAEQGQPVKVAGWVKSKRVSKKFAFLVINDGSCQTDLQVIVDSDKECFAKLESIGTGSSVSMFGELRKSPGKGQAWELHASDLEVLGESSSDYPLQKKGHSLEFLREIGHLRGRTNTFGAVYRVRNRLSFLVHQFFQGRGFLWAHTPILTASDCEGAGELFKVTTLDLANPPRNDEGGVDFSNDFFGKPTHLTVSGQLNAESMALSLGDVYTFGPTFRAENSNTTRHLSEFWMIEPEMAFANLRDDMLLAEEFLRYLFANIVNDCGDELEFLGKMYPDCDPQGIENMGSKNFARVSYTDAIKELSAVSSKFEFEPAWGVDLQTEHEKYLTEQVFSGPVIVTDYPKDIKAFYMKSNPDGKTVAAMDVLVPRIGEIIGGSQREDCYDALLDRVNGLDLPVEDLRWYLDLRSYGGCPHAGFGLGFERLVQYVTGMVNIRDVIPFPRAPKVIPF